MANLYFEAQLDADQLKRELRETRNRMNKFTKDVQANGAQMDSTFKRVGAAMAGYFSITAAKGFLDQVIQVRGEFQQLDIAMQTMLGSKAEADKLMAEVVELAAKTPFSLTELGQGAKRLLAFKEPTDRVGDSLRRLGDLAAGASVPVTDLIQAYGKVSAKGKMQAEELNQFAERGIPIISELAKVVGATDKEIYKMAEQGKIGFEELRQAILNMTDEGGQFFNLMEKQSGSLTGQISNLGDAWDRMLNEIGQDNEGIIYSGIDGLKSLVENYETVIDVLKVLVATYGAYKAVLVLTWAAQKAMALGQTIRSLQLMTKGINSATRAQVAFNTAAKANPWGLLAAGIAAVVTILPMFKKEQEEVVDITKDATEQFGKEKQSAEALFEQLKQTNSGSEKRARLIKEINSQYGTNLQNLQDEKKFLNQIEEARQGVIDKLKEEMILKSERIRIEENLSQQQVQKGLISMTEAEIQKLESLGSPQAVEAARKRLKGQQDNLNDLKDQLKQITKETAEQLDELFGSEDSSGGGRGKTTPFDAEAFKKSLSEQKKAYEHYNAALRSARDEDKEAVKDYYSDLLKQGEDYEQYLIKQLEAFRNNVSAKVAIYQSATAEGIDLTRATTTTPLKNKGVKGVKTSFNVDTKSLKDVDGILSRIQLKLQKIAEDDTAQMGEGFMDIAYTLQDVGRNVGQIDEGLGNAIGSMADIAGYSGQLMSSFASGGVLGSISGIVGIATSVMSLFGRNNELSKATFERYEKLTATIDDVVAKQQELLNAMAGEKAVKQTQKSIDLINKQIDATKNLGKEYLNSGASWKSHSHGYDLEESLDDYSKELEAIGINFKSLGGRVTGLFDLSPEQLNMIKEEVPEAWARLDDKTQQYLQNIIDSDEELKEMENSLDEALTGISFQTAKDELKELLLDVDTTMAEVASKFEDYMKKAIVGAIVNDWMDEELQEWYEMFSQAMSDGTLDSVEKNQLQEKYDNIYQGGMKRREAAYEAAGIDSEPKDASEDPLTGAIKGVSEQTASLIGGQMNAIRINQAESLRIINESIRYQSEIAANTRYNQHLEGIHSEIKSLNSKNKSSSDPLKAKGL